MMGFLLLLLSLALFVVAESRGTFPFKSRDTERYRSEDFDNQKGRCVFTSFHEDFTTWCTTNDRQVFVMKNGKWELVHGSLKYVSVGEAGVWGISYRNEIFYRQGVSKEKPEGLAWTKVDGNAVHVSSGPRGIVWIIRTDQRIAHRRFIGCGNPTGLDWKVVDGIKNAAWSSCSKVGCWVLLKQGNILFAGNVTSDLTKKLQWIQVDNGGRRLRYIEASFDGRNAVSTDGQRRIYAWNGKYENALWENIGRDSYLHATTVHFGYLACKTDYKLSFLITPPKCTQSLKDMKEIQAGNKNTVCGVSSDGRLYQKQGKLWVVMDGSFKQVSCSSHQMWAIDHYNNAYVRTSVNCSNPYGSGWRKLPGKLKRIDVGPFGSVHGIDFNDRILRREGITHINSMGTRWISEPGYLSHISCYHTACWGVDFSRNVYMRPSIVPDESSDRFESIKDIYDNALGVVNGLKLKKISATNDRMIWGVTEDDIIYFRMGVSKMNPHGSGWMYLFTKKIDVASTEEEFYTITRAKEVVACKFVK